MCAQRLANSLLTYLYGNKEKSKTSILKKKWKTCSPSFHKVNATLVKFGIWTRNCCGNTMYKLLASVSTAVGECFKTRREVTVTKQIKVSTNPGL